MEQNVEVTIAVRDQGDGSQGIHISDTRQEGLDWLDRTEEQLEEGNQYEDGTLITKILKIVDGHLAEPVQFDTDEYS